MSNSVICLILANFPNVTCCQTGFPKNTKKTTVLVTMLFKLLISSLTHSRSAKPCVHLKMDEKVSHVSWDEQWTLLIFLYNPGKYGRWLFNSFGNQSINWINKWSITVQFYQRTKLRVNKDVELCQVINERQRTNKSLPDTSVHESKTHDCFIYVAIVFFQLRILVTE